MSSPALQPRAASSTNNVPPLSLVASPASASKKATSTGTLSAFLKPKGAAPVAKAPAGKAPMAKVAPKLKPLSKSGAKPPDGCNRLLDQTNVVVPMGSDPDTTVNSYLDKLYVKDVASARPLTQEARDAPLRLLPVTLYDAVRDRWLLAVTQTSESSPFGGGTVYLASAYGANNPGLGKPLTQDDAGFLFNGLTNWTPGHAGAASPQLASLLWRLKATFKGFEWETVNADDVKAEFEQAKLHLDVVPLSLPPSPPHIIKDYENLPISTNTDKDAMKRAMTAWLEKGTHWTPPEGKWPCFPVAQHDPRAGKLSNRSDLAAAVGATVRAPNMGAVKAAFPSDEIGKGLWKLVGVVGKPRTPPPPAKEEEDDEEEAETRALLAPPPPKALPQKKEKRSGSTSDLQTSGAAFIGGMADHSGDEDGDEDDEDEDEEDSAEDGFIASDDDVGEAGSTASARKMRKEKASNKRKRNFKKNVDSGSENFGEEDDDERDESSEEEEMEGSGSDDGEEGESDDEDNVLVDARKDASDVDGMDSDDEEDGRPSVQVRRLKKTRDVSNGNKKPARPSSKTMRVVDSDEDEEPLSHSALLAEQRMSGKQSMGSKAPPKMGAIHSNSRVAKGLQARQKLIMSAPPQPKASHTALMDLDPESVVTPKKPANGDASQPPGAPAHHDNRVRDFARQTRDGYADAFDSIDKRIASLIEPEWERDGASSVYGKSKPGSIIGLSDHGAVNLVRVCEEARRDFTTFRDSEKKTAPSNAVIKSLLNVTGYLVRIIEAADGDEKTRKKYDNPNAELGVVAAQSMCKLSPQIEAVQKAAAELNTLANALVGTNAGMISRLVQATAKKEMKEGK